MRRMGGKKAAATFSVAAASALIGAVNRAGGSMTGTYLPAESMSAVPETAAVSAGIPAAVVSSGAFTRLSDVGSGAATEVAAGAAADRPARSINEE